MARIRSVKPDLFINEQVGTLSMAARVLFIGLFTQADRAGRIEWAPKRLKVQIFPYDDGLDVGTLAEELVTADLARVYLVDGVWCLDLPTFVTHQRPHPKEPDSALPACPEDWHRHGRPWKNTASRVSPGSIPDESEPWKNTASRVSPGSIPSSPVGREGKEISDPDQEGSGSHATRAIDVAIGPPEPPPTRHRGATRYADPHGMRPSVSAAALVDLGDGRVLEIQEAWARKARNDYRLTHDDIDAFARALGAELRRSGGVVDDDGKRFPWLDARLADWRRDRADRETSEREIAATKAYLDRMTVTETATAEQLREGLRKAQAARVPRG